MSSTLLTLADILENQPLSAHLERDPEGESEGILNPKIYPRTIRPLSNPTATPTARPTPYTSPKRPFLALSLTLKTIG